MSEKILFVDDEPSVLDSYRRLYRKDFNVETAVGPEAALLLLKNGLEYAVIVSDMRMPVMTGVEFLAKSREFYPETVRMVLTGHADMSSAIEAVNSGRIFKYLTKPCEYPELSAALHDAIAQYRIVRAEKELLNNTFKGVVEALTQVLGVTSPAAFGRAKRVQQYARHVAEHLALKNVWQYEVAAMLSQLGCIALDPSLVEKYCNGETLTPDEKAKVNTHPQIASSLLAGIPRLETVAWIVANQNNREPEASPAADLDGLTLIRASVAFDRMIYQGVAKGPAVERLTTMEGIPRTMAEAFAHLQPETPSARHVVCDIDDVRPGMLTAEEIRSPEGLLFVGKGQELTTMMLVRLRGYAERNSLSRKISVIIPKPTGSQ